MKNGLVVGYGGRILVGIHLKWDGMEMTDNKIKYQLINKHTFLQLPDNQDELN